MLPCFETDRLILRPRTMADFDACLAMDRDPEVTKYIPGPWSDPAQHHRFLTERMQTAYGPGLGYWSIFPKEEPTRFLGWILLIPKDAVGPQIEIGWRLNRFEWGKGYATEAALPIVQHAFQTVGVDRIIADINPHNTASMRVAEKLGFRFVADNHENGANWKTFSMTKDEFAPNE